MPTVEELRLAEDVERLEAEMERLGKELAQKDRERQDWRRWTWDAEKEITRLRADLAEDNAHWREVVSQIRSERDALRAKNEKLQQRLEACWERGDKSWRDIYRCVKERERLRAAIRDFLGWAYAIEVAPAVYSPSTTAHEEYEKLAAVLRDGEENADA